MFKIRLLATALALGGFISVAGAGEALPTKAPEPADNPSTEAKIELGKMLYHDPRLSSTGTVACASCHNVMLGGEDNRSVAVGVNAQTGGRSAPTVWNAAFNAVQFWDGRAPSLEAQAAGPVTNPIEMGMKSWDDVVARLKTIKGYNRAFADVFGGSEPVSKDNATKAMAMSVLILAFAFHDKPAVMFLLMAAAWGFHGSTILPAGAFLIVRYIKRTEIWLGFWAACVALTLIAGNAGEMLLSRFNPFAGDTRLDQYIVGSEGGFRADFIAYSIIPVVATLLLAAPTRSRARRLASRIMNRPAMNWVRNRTATRMQGMAVGRQLCLQAAGPVGSATPATSGRVSPALPPAPLSTLNSPLSTPARSRASGGQAVSAPRAGAKQNGWDSLPWVRLLHTDPFYARLVNTYLLANGVWVLLIHSFQSNRFSYLSWFMMPWVLLYPFVPGKTIDRPRTGLIAATLCAQYMFTYVMDIIVYPLRGGGML